MTPSGTAKSPAGTPNPSSQQMPPGVSKNPDDSMDASRLGLMNLDFSFPADSPHKPNKNETHGVKLNSWLLEEESTGRRKSQLLRQDEVTETQMMPSDYLLRQVVGEGGCGEVWEGIQHSTGRIVAVKRLRPDKFGNKAQSTKVLRYLEQNFRHEALVTS
ncbi:MAG: hypothetical protein SFY68_02445, partial [Candidatus Sumerlaeia bacterium]|nr:hypothetical protein [Candidatus Sumerlaeia bacterium]